MTVAATDLLGPVGSGGVGPDRVHAVLARQRDGLVERAVPVGAVLPAGLRRLGRLHPELVTNVRGRVAERLTAELPAA